MQIRTSANSSLSRRGLLLPLRSIPAGCAGHAPPSQCAAWGPAGVGPGPGLALALPPGCRLASDLDVLVSSLGEVYSDANENTLQPEDRGGVETSDAGSLSPLPAGVPRPSRGLCFCKPPVVRARRGVGVVAGALGAQMEGGLISSRDHVRVAMV